jgi:hypothetical protein
MRVPSRIDWEALERVGPAQVRDDGPEQGDKFQIDLMHWILSLSCNIWPVFATSIIQHQHQQQATRAYG